MTWVSYRASRHQIFWKDATHALPHGARDFLFLTLGGGRHEVRSDLGEIGFALLSTNALPAREELSKLVRDAKDAGEPWRQKSFEKILFTITKTPSQ